MLDLTPFDTEAKATGPKARQVEDPRTTFRQIQAQDLVSWLGSIFHAHAENIAQNPNDEDANDWFFSEAEGGLSFHNYCAIHGHNPEPLRAHIRALIKQGKDSS